MDKRTMIVVWKWDLQWTVDNGEVKKSWEHHDFIGCKSRFEIGVEGDESEAYTFIGFTKRKDCLDNELTLTENRPSYTEDGIIDECNKHLKDKNKVLLLLHAGRDDNFTKKSHVYKELKNKDNIFVDFFKGGGNVPIYKYIIDENSTYFREDAIIVNHTQLKIKKKNFDAVWNSYYSNYSLNELILLWMPLTIDIQGLSKLKHDGSDKNYSEYLGKIKDKWKNREISSLKKEHNKIIKCLESEENKEEMNSLKEKYNKIIAILENKHIEEIKENMLVDLSKLTHY